jgi:hypothetical protein
MNNTILISSSLSLLTNASAMQCSIIQDAKHQIHVKIYLSLAHNSPDIPDEQSLIPAAAGTPALGTK